MRRFLIALTILLATPVVLFWQPLTEIIPVWVDEWRYNRQWSLLPGDIAIEAKGTYTDPYSDEDFVVWFCVQTDAPVREDRFEWHDENNVDFEVTLSIDGETIDTMQVNTPPDADLYEFQFCTSDLESVATLLSMPDYEAHDIRVNLTMRQRERTIIDEAWRITEKDRHFVHFNARHGWSQRRTLDGRRLVTRRLSACEDQLQ